VALVFVYRSFYGMRIPDEPTGAEGHVVLPHDVSADEVVAGQPRH
jgi:hypothetical protein